MFQWWFNSLRIYKRLQTLTLSPLARVFLKMRGPFR